MPSQAHPALVDLLQATLHQIEVSLKTRPDDPAMLGLKRNITIAIGDLQISKGADTPASIDLSSALINGEV